MIKKFEEFIIERGIISIFDEYISINESRKEAKRVAEIAKKQAKKWNKEVQLAMDEYKKALSNEELMKNDYEKYLDESNKKMDKFNDICAKSISDPSLSYSMLIFHISAIKDLQTMLFKNGIKVVKKHAETDNHIKSHKNNGLTDKQIYAHLYKSQEDLKKYISGLIDRTSKNIEAQCNTINEIIDDIEESSDIHSIVFGDAKIKNKERNKHAEDFSTVYHSDIEYFVKEYKLIGIEYDKRIKLVDKQEIFNRFFKKIMKNIEENYK